MANIFEDIFDFFFGWALPDAPEYQGGVELSQPKATSEPLVYGEMKNAQGVIIETFIDDDPTTGGDIVNDLLYLHVVWSVGAVESIDQIYLDDIPIKSSLHGFEDDGSGTGFAYNWDYITDTQINEGHTFTLVDDVTTKTFHGKGFAHSIIRLQYSPEHVNHLPKITADIKGRVGLNDLSGGTTTTATSNPSIILWDYLTNTDYGRGIDVAQLNKPSFVAERDFADTLVYVDNTNTTQKKIMTMNTVLDCNNKLIDNIKTLIKGCRGFMPYIDGEFHFIIERDRSVEAFEFNDENRLSNFVVSDNEISDRYNRVTITFSDIEQKGKSATAIYPVDNTEYQTYLAEDAGVKLENSTTINTINNYAEALQMAEIILKRSRNALKVKTSAGSESKSISVGMVVPVSNEAFGMVSKPFIVVNRTKDADSVYKFELLEYQASIYPWVAGDPQVIPDSSVKEYWVVQKPNNLTVTFLTDGTGQALISWDSDAAETIIQLHSQYDVNEGEEGSEPDWVDSDKPFYSKLTSAKTHLVTNLGLGKYSVKVTAVNKLGYKSEVNRQTFDIVIPPIPVVNIDAGNFDIQINPTVDDNLIGSKFEMLINTVDDIETATNQGLSDRFTISSLSPNTTYYVWVRTVNYAGASEWVATTIVTTNDNTELVQFIDLDLTQVEADIDELNNVTIPGLESDINVNSDAITSLKNTTIPALQDDLNDNTTAINTINNVTLPALQDELDNVLPITETDITDGAISTPKLAANAVTAGKIAAGTITANEIFAGTITGNEIATDTITAFNMTAGSVTTLKLDALAVTTEKIAVDAITAEKIAANTITANEIATGAITANEMTVSDLSAISANLGTITAGTVTGAILQTSTDTAVDRVKIDGDTLRAYEGGSSNEILVIGAEYTNVGNGYINSPILQLGYTSYTGQVLAIDATRNGNSTAHAVAKITNGGTAYGLAINCNSTSSNGGLHVSSRSPIESSTFSNVGSGFSARFTASNSRAAWFNTPTNQAPFGCNSSVKVANLNADYLDGKHLSDLASIDTVSSGGYSWTEEVKGFTVKSGNVTVAGNATVSVTYTESFDTVFTGVASASGGTTTLRASATNGSITIANNTSASVTARWIAVGKVNV